MTTMNLIIDDFRDLPRPTGARTNINMLIAS